MYELSLENNLVDWCAGWWSSAFDWYLPRTLFSGAAKTHAWPTLLVLLLLRLGEGTDWQSLLTLFAHNHYLQRHILVFCGWCFLHTHERGVDKRQYTTKTYVTADKSKHVCTNQMRAEVSAPIRPKQRYLCQSDANWRLCTNHIQLDVWAPIRYTFLVCEPIRYNLRCVHQSDTRFWPIHLPFSVRSRSRRLLRMTFPAYTRKRLRWHERGLAVRAKTPVVDAIVGRNDKIEMSLLVGITGIEWIGG